MEGFLKIFILIFILQPMALALDIPYQDVAFGCIGQVDADRYVADFGIDVASFGGMELCKSTVETKKLFNDILILEQGAFEENVSNKFIKGFVEAKNYYGWLKNETRGIERGNDVPYAVAYNSGGYFTMQDGWARSSTLGRVGTFVHEARHTAGFRHISCTQGPYQGSNVSGCDTNYNYGGSHAVEMEYYARVAVQGTNFHPVYKKMARLMAVARSNIFFNAPILKTREALLALTEDGSRARLYDNGVWFDREVPLVTGRMKRTSFGAVLFDGLKAFSIELYQNSGFADVVEDTYSYYKLLSSQQEPVRDFEEFDSGIRRYAVKISKNNKLASYDFPNGAWGRELSVPFDVSFATTAVPGKAQAGLFLVSKAGDIFSYQPETQRLVDQSLKWDMQLKEVVLFKGQILALKTDGKIVLQQNNQFVPWMDGQETYSGLVSAPLYDGFEVSKE